jgi:hypothetical protein
MDGLFGTVLVGASLGIALAAYLSMKWLTHMPWYLNLIGSILVFAAALSLMGMIYAEAISHSAAERSVSWIAVAGYAAAASAWYALMSLLIRARHARAIADDAIAEEDRDERSLG